MKLGFAALIDGSQLTGPPAALASGESSVFAALLGEELASVPKAVEGMPRQAGDLPNVNAETKPADSGELTASAGQASMVPLTETGSIGLNVFATSATTSTTRSSDAPDMEPVQTVGEKIARPVSIPTDKIIKSNEQLTPLSKAGEASPETVKTAQPLTASSLITPTQPSDPAVPTDERPVMQSNTPVSIGQGQERSLPAGADGRNALASLADVTSPATTIAEPSKMVQVTAGAVKRPNGLGNETQAILQTVAAGPLMASAQQSGMAARHAPKAGKGEAITAASVADRPATVSVAAISASGESDRAGSGVVRPTQSSLLSNVGSATQQTAQSQPQLTPTPNQAGASPLNVQAGQVGFELLPEADADGLLTEVASETDTDTMTPQPLRADAKAVEAAAQNAVRNASAPHLAGLVSRVGEHFLQRFNGKTSSFEIRLDPPELGKVDIRVEVGADGKVMAVIAARDPSVVDALMRGAKTLENALTEAGLTLDEAGIQVELDQKDSSSFADAYSNEFADEYPGARSPEGENLAEAGPESPLNPVFQSWSRHRLDLTA